MGYEMRYQDVMPKWCRSMRAIVAKRAMVLTQGWLVVLTVLFGLIGVAAAQDDEEPQLMISSAAPALDIELWFSDRDGDFEKTTEFKPGKVYVIDFMQTGAWQSRTAISRYAILQDRYLKNGLQVISVSNEDEETVADFLELKVPDRPEMIYAELAMHFCFTSDPDRSVYDQYVGLEKPFKPVAFIVGKEGFVEWIGESSEVEKTLKKIFAGKWDRDAMRDAAIARKEMKIKVAQVGELYDTGDLEGALKLINEILAKWDQFEGEDEGNNNRLAENLALLRVEIMLKLNAGDIAAALQAVIDNHWEESYELNKVTWSIVLHYQAGNEISPKLLKVATDGSRQAEKLARKNGSDTHHGAILDTLAHLEYMGGNLDRALVLQVEAVKLYPDEEAVDYLVKLRKAEAVRDAEVEAADNKAAEAKIPEGNAAAQKEVEADAAERGSEENSVAETEVEGEQ